MNTNNPFAANLWRWKCNIEEIDLDKPEPKIDIDELYKSEWSVDFERLMRNRLVMGCIRYGKMGHGSRPKGKPIYDRISSIRKRLDNFENDGNAEWLVDIANIALLIFEEKQHPNFNFESVDDGYHDVIIKK